MIKKILNISELIFAVLGLVLIIIVFMQPPTDFDAGPMMAYNFLFYIPMTLLAGLFSIISIIIVVRKWIKKNKTKRVIKIISFCVALPITINAIGVVSYFFLPSESVYPEYEVIPDPTYNCSDSINLSTGKTMHFIGYNWGKQLENRRVYISLTPYSCDTFSIIETYCYQGSENLEVYYQLNKDSINVYIPDNFGYYKHHGEKYLDSIPVNNFKLPASMIDSMYNAASKPLMKFQWKETEPNKPS